MGTESEAGDVKSVFVVLLNHKNVTDIRRHSHIPRGPTFVRDAAQRYIGSQKTRSKCRRCFTVLERYGCAGLSVQIIYDISPQYNKDRFPIARAPRPERLLRDANLPFPSGCNQFPVLGHISKTSKRERSENRWFCLLAGAYRSASARVYALALQAFQQSR